LPCAFAQGLNIRQMQVTHFILLEANPIGATF
jgi:hypothetical protein